MERRQVLGGIGGVVAALGGCLGGDSPLAPPDPSFDVPDTVWWTYASDARNTGHVPVEGPSSPVEPLWTVGDAKAVYTTPSVVDGTVYFGASDNRIYAVDRETGEERWSYETGYYVTSSPTVVDGTVYAGSGDRNVYALDAETGSLVWERETDAQVDPAVTVTGDVVVAAGREGDGTGWVYGLERATGEVGWKHELDHWVTNAPAVAGDTVYLATQRGTVYAFDAAGGAEQWSVTKPRKAAAHLTAPAVVDGTLYVLMRAFDPEIGSRIYALSATSGREQWSRWLEGPNLPDTLAVADGTVFVVSEGSKPCEGACIVPKAILSAVDAESGELRWRRSWKRTVDTGPTVAADGVYFVAGDHVISVDAGDGADRWSYRLPEFAMRPPAVSDGTLFVGSADGALRALE